MKQNVNIKGPASFCFGDEDFVFTFKSQYYAHWLHMGEDVFASKQAGVFFWLPLLFGSGRGAAYLTPFETKCNYVIGYRTKCNYVIGYRTKCNYVIGYRAKCNYVIGY